MTPLPRLPALPTLSVTPQARPSLFKQAVAWLLMATISTSSLAQAVGPIIRGPSGAPLTGYTANGTYVQNGVVVGNPHQQLHDLTNPTLWTTGAVSFSNSTDPSFAQPTIDQMMAALAPPVDPGGLYLGRLYLNPTNPYTAGVGVLSAPPSPTPETGATPPAGPLIDNHEHYTRALAHAQTMLDAGAAGGSSGGWRATDPALGNGTAYLAKTHVDSSPELRNLQFDSAPGKAVFQAAQATTAGAVGYYAIQGEQAKNHLAHVQQQNAALLGTAIFFSQQRLKMPENPAPTTDWEGNRSDPMASFEAALGSAPSVPSYGGADDFVVGYIQPNGQAHEFQLQYDQHFRQFQSQQNWNGGEWGTSTSGADLNSLLGQELSKAATQHQAGQQAAASINFDFFKEDRALFMQGLDLYRHVNKSDWSLLNGLENGQIGPGHPDYERARALSQDAFRQAYAYHTEYETQFKHTKESAAYQAQQLDLKGYDSNQLFNQGLNLFDKKGDPEQERLLGMLQRGELKEDHPRYQEIRGLAEARYKVAYQKALEPPKKSSWVKQLVGVVIAAVAIYFGQAQIAAWAMNIGAAVGATSAFAVQAIGTAISATISSSISTTIATGSVSKGLQAGLKAGATGLLTGGLQTFMGGGLVGDTLARTISQTAVYGGDFGDNLLGNAISAGVDVISKDVAQQIKNSELSQFGKELAHAGLGCAAGTLRARDGSGCVPGASGALVAHLSAQWFDPAGGRTLSESETVFYSSLAGGTAAALAGNKNNVQANFGIGQSAGQNAVLNNYLSDTQWRALSEKLKNCQTETACAQVRKEYFELSNAQDSAMNKACQDLSSTACRAHIQTALLGSQTQQQLVGSGQLPDPYLGGSDLNAQARLTAINALKSDIQKICSNDSACQAKNQAALNAMGSTLLDFTPGIGDIKGYVEAETPFDYVLATLGTVGGPIGDGVVKLLKEGAVLYKAGKIGDAQQLMEQVLRMDAAGNLNSVKPSISGYLSKTKLGEAATVQTDTLAQRLMISDVVANGDKFGVKTESLVNDVLKSDPNMKVLDGTKYRGENGLDHVVQFVDPADGITKTMVIDSKQLAINGSTSLDPKAAGTALLERPVMQLSDESLGVIAGRLDGTPAGKAVDTAIGNGTLIKAVAYVDKTTGELKIVRVEMPNTPKN